MCLPTTGPQARRTASLIDLSSDAQLHRWAGLMGPSQADRLLATLSQTLDWQQPKITVYGRQHPVPRLTAWHGDAGLRYRYSGHTHTARGWPAALLPIKTAVEQVTGKTFNSVLANLYRNGDDCMGYHSDNEPELGHAPWVASYNLGACRELTFRPKGPGSQRQCLSVPLHHDDLLLMSPGVQARFEHALPRRRNRPDPRINLTFRYIIPEQDAGI